MLTIKEKTQPLTEIKPNIIRQKSGYEKMNCRTRRWHFLCNTTPQTSLALWKKTLSDS